MYNKYSFAKQIVAGATTSTYFKSKGFLISNAGTTSQAFTIHMRSGVTGATASVAMNSLYGRSEIFPLEIAGFTFAPANGNFYAYTLF